MGVEASGVSSKSIGVVVSSASFSLSEERSRSEFGGSVSCGRSSGPSMVGGELIGTGSEGRVEGGESVHNGVTGSVDDGVTGSEADGDAARLSGCEVGSSVTCAGEAFGGVSRCQE